MQEILQIPVRLPDFFYDINIFSVALRLLLAVLIGGVIGKERGKNNHPAGFRTHILVCVGATLAMLTNQYIVEYIAQDADPARIGAQVITGVGFLGVGTILVTDKYKIRGLTTAAGLWASACVGLALGIGFYLGGVVTGLVIYICLSLFQPLESRFYDRSPVLSIYMEVENLRAYKDAVGFLKKKEVNIFETISDKNENAIIDTRAFVMTIKVPNKDEKWMLLEELMNINGVLVVHEV